MPITPNPDITNQAGYVQVCTFYVIDSEGNYTKISDSYVSKLNKMNVTANTYLDLEDQTKKVKVIVRSNYDGSDYSSIDEYIYSPGDESVIKNSSDYQRENRDWNAYGYESSDSSTPDSTLFPCFATFDIYTNYCSFSRADLNNLTEPPLYKVVISDITEDDLLRSSSTTEATFTYTPIMGNSSRDGCLQGSDVETTLSITGNNLNPASEDFTSDVNNPETKFQALWYSGYVEV